MKTICLLDYGVGNIRSVSNALVALGAKSEITRDPARIAAGDGMILPGVGAFPSGMELLHQHGLMAEIRKYVQTGKPFLGICLGMQMLFDKGTEFGPNDGLSLVPGIVDRIPVRPEEGRLPHIAWSRVVRNPGVPDVMFAGLSDECCRFYFVHSFAARDVPREFVTGTVDYLGHQVIAAVQRGNVWGTQFHPEKSGSSGLRVLTNFIGQC
jgi:imidazole glycerol-phosphate synthase subunit HisH